MYVNPSYSCNIAKSEKPELIVHPLRMPIQVFSGIAPPRELIEQMNNVTGRPVVTNQSPYAAPNLRPPESVNRPPHSPSRPSAPPPPSDHIEPSPSDIPDEAPPSYEDAMADELAPIDGPRRDYHQTPSQAPGTDGRPNRGKERLFTDSDP